MRHPDALVIGEALVDVVHRDGAVAEHVGGSPANVALGLGRRGVDVALHTQLGADERGELIRRHLEASGVQILPESFGAAATARRRIASTCDGRRTRSRTAFGLDCSTPDRSPPSPNPARPSSARRCASWTPRR